MVHDALAWQRHRVYAEDLQLITLGSSAAHPAGLPATRKGSHLDNAAARVDSAPMADQAAAAAGPRPPSARAAAGSAVARITQAIKQEIDPDSQRAAPASRQRRRPTSKAAKTTLPHQLAASRPADWDLDVLRKRALLGLQIRAGLDASPSDRAVYETHKWDPCKPFVADKILKLPCMVGRHVVYCSGTTTFQPRKDTACAAGHIADNLTIKCLGCNFKGSRTAFEQHLGSGAKKASQHIFLKEEQISLKELGVLCSAVDLNLTNCVYCKRDQTADDDNGGSPVKLEQQQTDTAAAPAAASTDAPAGQTAAAAAGRSGSAAGGLRFNTVVTCSTCPAVFHTSCYEVNTGKEVGGEDDWQCVSCRQGARCAAGGCAWCTRHSPHLRRFTMAGQFEAIRREVEPQQAEVKTGNAGRVNKTAAAAAGAAAAAEVWVKQEGGVGSVAQPSGATEAAAAAAAGGAAPVSGKGSGVQPPTPEQAGAQHDSSTAMAGGVPLETAASSVAPVRHGKRTAAVAVAAAAAAAAAGCRRNDNGEEPSHARKKKKRKTVSASPPPPAAAAAAAAAAAGGGHTSSRQGTAPPAGKKAGTAKSSTPPPPAAACTPDRVGTMAAAEPAQAGQGRTGSGRRRHGRQQQDEQQPRTPGTPGVQQQQQGSPLQLTKLGEGEWLPDWVNHYQAEEALYSMCMAAEVPDELVLRLQAVMNRLQGLAPLDLPVCRFRAHYARLLLWGKRRNVGEFEAALRRLASM